MRKLVRKVNVTGIKPIPGADSIELALIDGWQCVVKKGEFAPGSEALYFEIDSALPVGDARYSFLRDRCLKEWKNTDGRVLDSCFRIRTMKMRGEISQGLLLPVEEFPEVSEVPIGEDCSEALGVRLYDDLDGMYSLKFKSGQQKGPFPSWIPKTDEERIQNLPDYWEKFKDMEFEVTRKVDGSSMTVFYAPSMRPEDPFGVCSRNFEMKMEDDSSSYVSEATREGLREILKKAYEDKGLELAVQGELNGLGLNGNRDKLTYIQFSVFRMWDISRQCFITSTERLRLCRELGLGHVPMIAYHFKAFRELPDMESMLKFAEGKTENGNEREGLVFKQEDSEAPVSFKVISNAYLLKEK